MSPTTSQEFIQTLVGAEVYVEEHEKQGNGPPPPFVTISRSCGSNSSAIAEKLAQRLRVPLYDKNLLDEIVKAAKGDKYLLEQLDEHVTGLWDEVLQSFFSRKGMTREDYYHYLIKVLLSISRSGGVVVGRGAHLLVPNRKVFRLRLEGSMGACAKRMADRLNIKVSKAEKMVAQTDKERREFVKELYKRFPLSKKAYYDLVVNTDIFSPDQTVEIVARAMEVTGFPVPPLEIEEF